MADNDCRLQSPRDKTSAETDWIDSPVNTEIAPKHPDNSSSGFMDVVVILIALTKAKTP